MNREIEVSFSFGSEDKETPVEGILCERQIQGIDFSNPSSMHNISETPYQTQNPGPFQKSTNHDQINQDETTHVGASDNLRQDLVANRQQENDAVAYVERASHIMNELINSKSKAEMNEWTPRKRPRTESGMTDHDNASQSSELIALLELELTKSQNDYKLLKIQFDSNLNMIENLQGKIEHYRQKAQNVAEDLKEEWEERLDELSSKIDVKEAQHQIAIKQLEQEISTLSTVIHEKEKETTEYKKTIQSLMEQNRSLLQKKNKLEEKMDSRSSDIADRHESLQKEYIIQSLTQDLNSSKDRITQLEIEVKSVESKSILQESLSSDLEELKKLRRENKLFAEENERLKKRVENVLILKDKIDNLQKELNETHKVDDDIMKFLLEYDEMKRRTQEWVDLLNASSAAELHKFMKLLQEDNESLTSANEALTVQAKVSNELNQDLEDEITKLTKQLFSQESILISNQQIIEDQKQQIYLLEQERDSTTEVLKTYDREQEEANRKRIEELENQIEALRQQNITLKEEKKEMDTKMQNALLEQRKELHDVMNDMKKKFQEEQSQKILHFRLNPQVQASANANNELVRLRSQVKILEERIHQCQTLSHTSEILTQEFNKRLQRHNEVFKEKIGEFRRAMYLLCGYRVDVLDEYQYKLSSMYAEQKDDYLLFQYEPESKQMNLVETPFALTLQNEGEALQYLKMNSIPGFTSQVTIDLLSKQTIFTA